MNQFFTVSFAAIASFTATNLDDIIILILFFSSINRTFRVHHIIIGQYLGFTVIVLASSIGILGGTIVPREWLGLLGFVPLAIGLKLLFSKSPAGEIQGVSGELTPEEKDSRWRSFFSIIPAPIYHVASVTIANGGDNIGIYVPLFANLTPVNFLITLTIFYLMLGLWCDLAYYFTRHPSFAKIVNIYGHKIIPFVFITLGIYLLIETKSYRLIFCK